MIITIAHARVEPMEREMFLTAVPAFLRATRAEPGCIVYDIVESVDEPNHFVTVERWDERASVDAHMAAAHTQTFLGIVGTWVAEAPTIEVVTVSSVERLM